MVGNVEAGFKKGIDKVVFNASLQWRLFDLPTNVLTQQEMSFTKPAQDFDMQLYWKEAI